MAQQRHRHGPGEEKKQAVSNSEKTAKSLFTRSIVLKKGRFFAD